MVTDLLNFEYHKDDYIVQEMVTEQGIYRMLGCSWGLVSVMLKNNIKIGYIYRVKSKVAGKKYKQFAYFLTKKGRKYAMKIKRATK